MSRAAGAAGDAPAPGALRCAIVRHIVERGHAPDTKRLGALFGCAPDAVRAGLKRLADAHGIALHPDGESVWAAHPFSLAPTPFLVRRGGGEWWGNCAWCSLGIAGLLGGGVTITTTLGARDRQVAIHVEDGAVRESGLVVHFPVPMRRAWDNVIYACSTMLVFDSETAVNAWSRRAGIPRGDVRPLSVVAAFARDWYATALDPHWRKWTVAEARALFARHGLDGPIRDLPESGERF